MTVVLAPTRCCCPLLPLPWHPPLLGHQPTARAPVCAQVWEEMNVAYSNHEIIADFTTAALVWFESG